MNNLIDKLPYFYDNGITRPIIDAEQIERDVLIEEIEDVLKQMYVSTATWGLDYWEKMLYIPTIKSKSYEERRSVIYAKMRSTRTTTVKVVKELAMSFFETENVDVIEDNSHYIFNIEFENANFISSNLIDLCNSIDLYKPAHLNYGFTFSVKTNVQVNSSQKIAYSILPICNITYVGTWWKSYADGSSNGGKVIQAKSYDGYSKLNVCGVYKCKIKRKKGYVSDSLAIVGTAIIGGD